MGILPYTRGRCVDYFPISIPDIWVDELLREFQWGIYGESVSAIGFLQERQRQ